MTSRFVAVLCALVLVGPAVHAADFSLRLPLGRYTVTKREEHKGGFKPPTLRDVTRHPPYMHDGSVRSLAEVVALYNRGGTPNLWLSGELRPLGLSNDEQADLVAFLEALTGEVAAEVRTPPRLPR
jgi:cytochrome c peroxidase